MSGYTKLFGSLIHSTIWREPDHVRVLWVTILAMVNGDGVVEASVPGLADASRIDVTQCRHALSVLSSPDPDSRTPDFEGRRVEAVDGGWRILNFEKYRDKLSEADRKTKSAERSRRYRERRKAAEERRVTSGVTPRHAPSRDITRKRQEEEEAEAEAEAEEESDLTGEVGSEDLTGGAREEPPPSDRPPANGSGARDEDRETMCPADLEQRAVAVGIPAEFARHYSTSPESIIDAIREHVSYWTIGRGAGQRRAHWMRHLREHLRKAGEQKKFKPPGLVEHEQNEGLSEDDKRTLAKARKWREEQDALKRGTNA